MSVSQIQPAAKGSLLITPRLLRDLHTYLAVLFAPTILFFALTGSLQVFSLHEGQANGYQLKPRKSEPAKSAQAQAPKIADAVPVKVAEPMKPTAKRGPSVITKAFFGAAAIGLTLASLLGLWIGLTQGRLRKVSAFLAVLGAILPIALVMFA